MRGAQWSPETRYDRVVQLLPIALRRNDRVAVVSPAGPVRDKEALENGLKRLRRWGLRPEVSKRALESFGFLAGQDPARLADLQAAIADPAVRGIFCTRGGYGVTRILDGLDLTPLASDPKPIVGYSDVTALHAVAWNSVGLVGFHGPMVAGDGMDGTTEDLQRDLLFSPAASLVLPADAAGPPPHVMNPGVAEGALVGGNLSLLAALAGTPYAPKTAGSIVFIEDTDEAPYRIDRMLTHLFHARFFDGVSGVIVGDFANAAPPQGTEATDLDWVLHDRLGRLKVPVAYGFPFGHRSRSWTLPVGVRARLEAPDRAKTPRVVLLEPSVRSTR
jgi:muramoyltetrapeptide carboxypeptidase